MSVKNEQQNGWNRFTRASKFNMASTIEIGQSTSIKLSRSLAASFTQGFQEQREATEWSRETSINIIRNVSFLTT